jgi:hypothetical protein
MELNLGVEVNVAILDPEYSIYAPTETNATRDDLIEYSLDTTVPYLQRCGGIINTKELFAII